MIPKTNLVSARRANRGNIAPPSGCGVGFGHCPPIMFESRNRPISRCRVWEVARLDSLERQANMGRYKDGVAERQCSAAAASDSSADGLVRGFESRRCSDCRSTKGKVSNETKS